MRAACILVLLAAACAPRRPPADAPAPGVAPATEAPGMLPDRDGETLAAVQALLLAHRLAPTESLAVRLLGRVGADGSYALAGVDVQMRPGAVDLTPRVRRQAGDAFIQMEIPLDHTLRLELPPGRHVVTVHGAEGTLADTVTVEPGALRPPPAIAIEAAAPGAHGAEEIVPVSLVARAGDGFVARIELREVTAAGASEWRLPEGVQAEGDTLRAWASVRRPARDAERRVEARAVDGQGEPTPAPAVLRLPAR